MPIGTQRWQYYKHIAGLKSQVAARSPISKTKRKEFITRLRDEMASPSTSVQKGLKTFLMYLLTAPHLKVSTQLTRFRDATLGFLGISGMESVALDAIQKFESLVAGILVEELGTESSAFEDNALHALSICCQIPMSQSAFVRLSIEQGKVYWAIRQDELWWYPESDADDIQELEPGDDPDFDHFHDMTLEDFQRFKAAGKRTGSDKVTEIDGVVVMDRTRPDRNAKATAGPTVEWDVGTYKTLVSHYPKKPKAPLDKDHCPQDAWLLRTVTYAREIGKVIKALQKLSDPKVNHCEKKKKAYEIADFLSNETVAEFLGLGSWRRFRTFKAFLKTHENKRFSTDIYTKFDGFTKSLGNFCRGRFAGWETKLQAFKDRKKNEWYAIAVKMDMHGQSRTFARKGQVTPQRRDHAIMQELFLDIQHYIKKGFVTSLESLGAFRYLVKRSVAYYAWEGDDDEVDYIKRLDALLLKQLKKIT